MTPFECSTRPHSHELAVEDFHPIEPGFPCSSKTPAANMPSPLPRRTCRALSSLASPAVAAFPLFQRGRRSHYPLGLACRRPSPPRNEACSVFTHITACSLADPLAGPFRWQYLNGFVTSTVPAIATGWNDSSRVGFMGLSH